jgi:hypothetical protein
MKLRPLVMAGAMSAAVLAGCGSTSSSSSSSTTTSPVSSKQAVCTARDNFKKSVTALTSPALLTGGKAGIQSAVASVKKSLDAVVSAAKSAHKPQVDAMKSAMSDLDKALGNLGSGSVTSNLQAVGTAIARVGTTAETLISTLHTECPTDGA